MSGGSAERPVLLVLGASGGIGAATSRRLAAAGARLVLGARSGDRLHALAEEIGAEARVLDATRADEVDACVAEVVQRHGRLDGAVNCVGSLLLKPAHLTRPEEWDAVVATNLTTAFLLVRAAARAMTPTGGSIVLVSSAAARVGLPGHEAIAAAKAGVVGLTLSAAATYAPRSIRVNAVAPGLVDTPMTARITASETARSASLAMHALGRLGEPADVAAAIGWLLSAEAGWVTGQVIGVDGGLATLRGR